MSDVEEDGEVRRDSQGFLDRVYDDLESEESNVFQRTQFAKETLDLVKSSDMHHVIITSNLNYENLIPTRGRDHITDVIARKYFLTSAEVLEDRDRAKKNFRCTAAMGGGMMQALTEMTKTSLVGFASDLAREGKRRIFG